MAKSQTKPHPPQITVAILNAAGVYLGVESINLADKTAEHFEVPADCDLTPGRYRLDRAHSQFVALPDDQVIDVAAAGGDAVSRDQVLFALVAWATGQGANSPVFDAFTAQFKKSIDAAGSKS